jgi:hypothetical protein
VRARRGCERAIAATVGALYYREPPIPRVSFFQSKLECLSGKRTPKPIFGALDERRDQSMRLTADAKIGPN